MPAKAKKRENFNNKGTTKIPIVEIRRQFPLASTAYSAGEQLCLNKDQFIDSIRGVGIMRENLWGYFCIQFAYK